MILVFTGNGKGKTTSAIGQGIRALGQKRRVWMTQFIKSDIYPSGEDSILPHLEGFVFSKGGKGFVGILGDKLPFEEHQKAAEDTLAKARDAVQSGVYDIVILDEINVAIDLGLLDLADVVKLAKETPDDIDLILTGRGEHQELIDRADIVTNFQEVKHAYNEGVKHKKGREY